MYAVIRTGGKQYRVSQDDVLRVEKLDAEVGATVKLEVLAIGEGESLKIGTPVVADHGDSRASGSRSQSDRLQIPSEKLFP